MRTKLIFSYVLLISWNFCFSQPLSSPDVPLTGNLRSDIVWSMSQSYDTLEQTFTVTERRSPLTAALYSAAIPGAGQLYNESYLESIGFIGAEIGLWVAYAVYNARADKQTEDFQNFADLNWSVIKYAMWMEQHFAGDVVSGMYDTNYDPSRPWDYVDWNRLNQSEDNIARKPTTTGFTHRLPRRPEQQYFELIGKYPQYGGGWEDAGSFTPSDILQNKLSEKFLFYSRMRGDANDLYAIASTVSYFIIANHLLSAVEAAWSAARFNSSLKMEAHLLPRQWSRSLVEFVPTAKLKIEF